jgi:sigma-E factor negative regulatory protein RseA
MPPPNDPGPRHLPEHANPGVAGPSAVGDAAGHAAWLSALADGQPDALQRGCDAWRQDAQARAAWHAYHLIGDAMRSDELGPRPGSDAAFLARLRGRLEAEPVVLAPQAAHATPADRVPLPARAEAPTAGRRQRWLFPAAAAAGFVAVAGVLVVARMGQPDATGGAPLQAGAGAAGGAGVTLVGAGAADARAPRPMAPVGVIRDPALDRYLQAHQEALGAAAAVPGGAKRSVDLVQVQSAR